MPGNERAFTDVDIMNYHANQKCQGRIDSECMAGRHKDMQRWCIPCRMRFYLKRKRKPTNDVMDLGKYALALSHAKLVEQLLMGILSECAGMQCEKIGVIIGKESCWQLKKEWAEMCPPCKALSQFGQKEEETKLEIAK